MKNRLLGKVFSSSLQAIAVQVLGGVFFYFISIYISKDEFGMISWANAVSVFITTLLGFGLEQVVVRRIAASRGSDWAAAIFFAHSFAGFLITFVLLLLLRGLIKGPAVIYKDLPWFFLAQGLIFIAVPLKQFLNAKEQFTPYGIIAVISNICKIAVAWILLMEGRLYINTVLIILICTAGFELVSLSVYLVSKTSFSFKLQLRGYVKLVKESSAQYLSVIFDISLSRTDWILLGVMTSGRVLADYSFAYRAYELARLPLLIIAPIILPRFARLLSPNVHIDARNQQSINSFSLVELFFAALIPLILNILWVPFLTLLTNGKYGESNAWQFLILSLCIPLQFFINLLWSLSFGAKKYAPVSVITIVCAVVNVILNLVLISKFKGVGASLAFLGTTILQAILYYRLVKREIMVISVGPVLVFTTEAVITYLIASQLSARLFVQLPIAVGLYLFITILFKQVTGKHFKDFKQLLSK